MGVGGVANCSRSRCVMTGLKAVAWRSSICVVWPEAWQPRENWRARECVSDEGFGCEITIRMCLFRDGVSGSVMMKFLSFSSFAHFVLLVLGRLLVCADECSKTEG